MFKFARVDRIVIAMAGVLAAVVSVVASNEPNMFGYANPTGIARTYDEKGAIDSQNPFFQSLGTNGRSCGSCHAVEDGWTIVPSHVQARFDATDGEDPIFRTNDGSNSPWADVSTVDARRRAYNMLLSRGLIRVGIGVPANAEFELLNVDDPYGYASASELSLFRRPLPSTNLEFLSAVMWDGRETFANQTIHFDLSDQANGATLGHAASTNPLTPGQQQAIVDFETGLYTTQAVDNAGGVLNGRRATGGPMELSHQPYYIGINDALSPGFNPRVFTLYDAWRDAPDGANAAARAAIYRGQEIFNTKTFTVSGVRGVNDALGVPALAATCTTCHDSPNVGNHSVPLPLDLGLTDESRRTPDMPLYTFRNKTTGEIKKVTDPGRALIDGKWAHMSRFKGPTLRDLAPRAPYFHNGFAADLDAVIDFYEDRFNIGFTKQERADIIAFLRSL